VFLNLVEFKNTKLQLLVYTSIARAQGKFQFDG